MRVIASDPDRNLYQATFSPNQKWIAFNATSPGLSAIYVVSSEGGQWTVVTEGTFWDDKPRWSPDGKTILVLGGKPQEEVDKAASELWLVDVQEGKARRLEPPVKGLRYLALVWTDATSFVAFTGRWENNMIEEGSERVWSVSPASTGEMQWKPLELPPPSESRSTRRPPVVVRDGGKTLLVYAAYTTADWALRRSRPRQPHVALADQLTLNVARAVEDGRASIESPSGAALGPDHFADLRWLQLGPNDPTGSHGGALRRCDLQNPRVDLQLPGGVVHPAEVRHDDVVQVGVLRGSRREGLEDLDGEGHVGPGERRVEQRLQRRDGQVPRRPDESAGPGGHRQSAVGDDDLAGVDHTEAVGADQVVVDAADDRAGEGAAGDGALEGVVDAQPLGHHADGDRLGEVGVHVVQDRGVG